MNSPAPARPAPNHGSGAKRQLQAFVQQHWKKLLAGAVALIFLLQVAFVDFLRIDDDSSQHAQRDEHGAHRGKHSGSGAERLERIVRETAERDARPLLDGADGLQDDGKNTFFTLPPSSSSSSSAASTQQHAPAADENGDEEDALDRFSVQETAAERADRMWADLCHQNQSAEAFCGFREMEVPLSIPGIAVAAVTTNAPVAAASVGGSKRKRNKKGKQHTTAPGKNAAATTTPKNDGSGGDDAEEEGEGSGAAAREASIEELLGDRRGDARLVAAVRAMRSDSISFVCPDHKAPGDFAHCLPEHEARPAADGASAAPTATTAAAVSHFVSPPVNQAVFPGLSATSEDTVQILVPTLHQRLGGVRGSWSRRLRLGNVSQLPKPYGLCRVLAVESAAKRSSSSGGGSASRRRGASSDGNMAAPAAAGVAAATTKSAAAGVLGADDGLNPLLPRDEGLNATTTTTTTTAAPTAAPPVVPLTTTPLHPEDVRRVRFVFDHPGANGNVRNGRVPLSLGPFGCKPPGSVVVEWTPAMKSFVHGRNHIVIRLDGTPVVEPPTLDAVRELMAHEDALEAQRQKELRLQRLANASALSGMPPPLATSTTTTTAPGRHPKTPAQLHADLWARRQQELQRLMPPRQRRLLQQQQQQAGAASGGKDADADPYLPMAGKFPCRVSVQAFSVTSAGRYCGDPSNARPFFPPTVPPANPGSRDARAMLTYSIEVAGLSSLDLFTSSAEACSNETRFCRHSRFPDDTQFLQQARRRAELEALVAKFTTTTTTTTTTRPATSTTTTATTATTTAPPPTLAGAAATANGTADNGAAVEEKKPHRLRAAELDARISANDIGIDKDGDGFIAAGDGKPALIPVASPHQAKLARRNKRMLQQQTPLQPPEQPPFDASNSDPTTTTTPAPPPIPLHLQALTPEAARLARSAAVRCDGGMYMGYTNVIQSFVVCALLTALCGRPVMEYPRRLHHTTLDSVFDMAAVNRRLERKLGISVRLVGPAALENGISSDPVLYSPATPTRPRMVGGFQSMCMLRPWATIFVGDMWPTRINIAAAEFHAQFTSSVLVPSKGVRKFSDRIVQLLGAAAADDEQQRRRKRQDSDGADTNNGAASANGASWVAIHLRFEDDAVKLGGRGQTLTPELRARRIRSFIDTRFPGQRVYYASGRLSDNISTQLPLLGYQIRKKLLDERAARMRARRREFQSMRGGGDVIGNTNSTSNATTVAPPPPKPTGSRRSGWSSWWKQHERHPDGYVDDEEVEQELGGGGDNNGGGGGESSSKSWVTKNDLFPRHRRPWTRTFRGKYFNGREINITNATGSAIDMQVLVAAPVAVVAEFSSFGEVVAAVRCAMGKPVFMYDVDAAAFAVDCEQSVLFRRSLHEQIRAAEASLRALFHDSKAEFTGIVHDTLRRRKPQVATRKLRELRFHFYDSRGEDGDASAPPEKGATSSDQDDDD